MGKVSYELENESPPAALAPPDVDFEAADPRIEMLRVVEAGVRPSTAAAALGIPDWEKDPAFAALVARNEARARMHAERVFYTRVTNGKTVPAHLWYYLQAFSGYNRKAEEQDDLPQDVTLQERVYDGTQSAEA